MQPPRRGPLRNRRREEPPRRRQRSGDGSEYRRKNLRLWERTYRSYDRRNRGVLSGSRAAAWGLYRLPEDEVGLLGPVPGRRILEIGCGGGRWSAELERRGAVPVGIDPTRGQLEVARGVRRRLGSRFPLVRGIAERLPFREAVFDVAFCDWGALSFADPRLVLPECARVLRPGGRLAFATSHPIAALFVRSRGPNSKRLLRSYFGLERLEFPEEVTFQFPFSEWFTLFHDSGFVVERLLEPEPRGRSTPYLSTADWQWAKRWPVECLWSLRKATPAPRGRARPREVPSAPRPAARRKVTTGPRKVKG